MCLVSAVTFPGAWPNSAPEKMTWNQDTWSQFNKILEMLKSLDNKMGLKDCQDDAKSEWMKRVEERLAQLERSE